MPGDGDKTLPPDPPDDGGSGADRGSKARKAFLLRLPTSLHAELRTWANHEFRSLNAHIEFLLREAVRRRRPDDDRDDDAPAADLPADPAGDTASDPAPPPDDGDGDDDAPSHEPG